MPAKEKYGKVVCVRLPEEVYKGLQEAKKILENDPAYYGMTVSLGDVSRKCIIQGIEHFRGRGFRNREKS